MREAIVVLACLSVTATSITMAAPPHVHGTGELRIAVESDTINIELHSPMDNVLGFEYTPHTAAQRDAVKTMNAKLAEYQTLFKLPNAAMCKSTATPKIESSFNEPLPAPAKSTKSSAKKAAPEPEEDHADLTATYTLVCVHIDQAASLQVNLFDVFPRTQIIKVEAIGPRGQSAVTLTPSSRTVRL